MTFAGTYKVTERGILGLLLAELTGLNPDWYAPITFVQDDAGVDPYTNTNAWMGGMPGMTEKKGDPRRGTLKVNLHTIVQKDWECSVVIPKKDWVKNRGQIIQKRIQDQAVIVRAHPGDLIQNLIENGATTACYDTQYFFDDDHLEGSSGTQSNKLTSTAAVPATPTKAEMKTGVLKAVAAILGFKNDRGVEVNLGAKDFLVGAPLTHYTVLLETLGIVSETGGNTDVLKPANEAFTLTPQPMPKLTGNKIVVFRRRQPRMGSAFSLDISMPVEPVILGLESEHCKKHSEVLVSASGTYNAGYADWKDGVQVTFS